MLLRTLGGLELVDSSFHRPKTLLLLAYLALEGPKERQHLAMLLWPQTDKKQRLHRLRVLLSQLRQEVPGVIEAEGAQVWSTLTLDAKTFLDLAEAGRNREALKRYGGPFLQGFDLPNWGIELEEWAYGRREFLASRAREALLRLGEEEAAQGRFDKAAQHAEAAYLLSGAPEPEPEDFVRCHALLVAGNHPRAHDVRKEAQGFAIALCLSPQEAREQVRRVADGATPAVHNLPAQTTPFIGREQELTEIRKLLLDDPECRLLTLFGPGGIGKTRLALAAATQSIGAFPQGVYFVPLTPVSKVAFIVLAIAEALRFTFYGQAEPKDQLLDYLSRKQLLLVVDNFEHLLDGADLLPDILRQAPEVILLVTSRERLHLQEEWVYEVQGLPFPTVKDTVSAVSKSFEILDAYAAVQLFLQRARQTQAGFAPSTDEIADIGRICQLVEGMPLGLELAAPWIRTLSCREIATEIEHSRDFLATSLRNMPERHRSLKGVFEQTWSRLSQTEQAVLMRLSVFRGGCTREAAEAVAGATLRVLSSLANKALIRRTKLGRYELHELIRQFAEAQLQTDPEVMEQAQQQYQDHFITFLETRTAGVKGSRQKATLVEIKADMDNVRLAWRRAAANRDTQAIERAAECLFVFYLYSSGHYEGQSAFQLAAAAFSEGSNIPDDSLPDKFVVLDNQEDLVGFLLAGQGYFLARTQDPHAGQTLLEQALALLRRAEPRDRRREGFALLWLGWALNFQGRYAEAQERGVTSLPLFSEATDSWGEGWGLLLLGNNTINKRPREAEDVLQRALTACRKSGDQAVLGYVTHNLGRVVTIMGRYAEARMHIDEAIRIFEELGNRLGLGYALERRGQLARFLGEYRQAIYSFQQALTIFSEVKTEQNVSLTQEELGMVYRLQGRHDQAEHLYQQAQARAMAVNNRFQIASCLSGLGCLAYDRGELLQAKRLHQEALVIWQELEMEVRMADAWHQLGCVLVASGEQHYAEARDCFQQALELAARHQLAPLALDVCVGLAQLLALTGKTEQAVELLTLVEQHEACTFETRKKGQQLLTELVGQSKPETALTAQARGQVVELWTSAHLLLAELAKGRR